MGCSLLYWRWYRPHSDQRWQSSKIPWKDRCEITSSWRDGCTTNVQRNCRQQSTSPWSTWQRPLNGSHEQAIMLTTTHVSQLKKSGHDLRKCTKHPGKCSHINDQRSFHIPGSNGQSTTWVLQISNGRRVHIDSAQYLIHHCELMESKVIACQANWL